MDHKNEILSAIQELAIEQATLRQKVEHHLKITDKLEGEVSKLKDETKQESKLIQRHDIFMKASIWVYTFIISSIGIKELWFRG